LYGARVKIDAPLPPIFITAIDPPSKRYRVWYGGRGGAKSWSVARILLIKGIQTPIRVLCTREYQASIADSVHALLSDQIRHLGLESVYDIKRDEIVGVNGTQFIFAGIRRDPKKIKSTEGIDIAWVEEADTISNESLDLLIPTIRKKDSEIWITFNPDQPDDPVYKRFIETERDDTIVTKVGYTDNPWFPEVLKKELEWDKAHDTDKYMHVWEGEPRRASNAQVFSGRWRVESFDTPESAQFYHGADWGFSVDPTALVRCYVHDTTLYIDAEAYGVGVAITDTPALFDIVPTSRQWPIIADSARPETIHHMRQQGYKMTGARKGKGSVEDGIEHIKGYHEIVVHPRCKHTIDELKMYSYKLDRLTGEPTPVLEDKHNHMIDALRYALEPVMRVRKRTGITARSLGL
jgi:phage terminase large subunit